MTDELRTPDDLAREFKITTEKLHELRKRHHWPHVRLGRFEVRFTPEQVAAIVAMHSATPDARPARPVPVEGQTARSAARSRSA